MNKENSQFFVKIYAVLYWVIAGFFALGALLMLIGSGWIASLVQSGLEQAAQTPGFKMPPFPLTAAFFLAIGAGLLVLALFYFFVALGIWKRQPWARIATIVISICSVFSFPFGTLIGGFGIYLFGFNKYAIAVFKRKR